MDYSTLSLKQLTTLCKEKGIKGYSKKKKDELITLISHFKPEKLEEIREYSVPKEKNTNISPLRYPGGKTRAIHILYTILITHFPSRKTVLSPFFGGGSFELFLSSKGYLVFGNDLFTPLYNFWLTTQTNRKSLIDNIRDQMPVTKESFHSLRNTIMKETDILKSASSFFLINRTSFSGATLSGGYSEQASKTRLTESSIKRLSECNVDSIVFSNLDCNDFLDDHPESSSSIIYADPPYYIKDYIYGKDGNMHDSFNHEKFADKIRSRKDWIISYNDCEYIRNLYVGCRIIETSWSYGMNKSKVSSEIIILPSLS